MHAWAPESSGRSDAGYERKSSWIMTLSFDEEGEVEGKTRRERTTMEVMDGWRIHWSSTSPPITPELPVKMIFMLLNEVSKRG